MKRLIGAALIAALCIPGAASAHDRGLSHDYRHAYWDVHRKLGKRAPGRDIASRGVRIEGRGVIDHTRPARKREKAKSLRQLRELLVPAAGLQRRLGVPPSRPPAGVMTPGARGYAIPTAIVMCESNGNPRAENPTSTASGLYQVIDSTWRAYGGAGSHAADASLEEQHRVAALIWDGGRGRGQWAC